ncbi:hypothetical protein A33M_3285 [Rhodovulum sp. PH10]|uniref:hypothetical protein n=1 Tax=Rhodovulum sp. PH10 TaxID=1187851 RepID=UPI00027C27D2|nr:hypothetical protein [Rhodovulum sp. PH10]EJW11319.1 hypothetical protein A33M_3285 [Rhodovulum sp. PH10]
MTRRIATAVVAGLVALAPAVSPAAAEPQAAPLVGRGIGTTPCATLARDLKPAEGLSSPVGVMLYAWVQGYASAANVALLETTGTHVDLAPLDQATVLTRIADYCAAHPDARPIAAVDDLLRHADKHPARWDRGTVDWTK